MIFCLARKTRLFALSAALVVVCATSAPASVHLTYDVLKEFPVGTSASWLHSADASGATDNGADFNGDTSSRITGVLAGDLDGKQLSNLSGLVSGKLKMLSVHLSDLGLDSIGTYTPFELKFGSTAGSGRTGALELGTDGAGGIGPFIGGYVDFALEVGGTTVLDGTFFFKPQIETESLALNPNQGNSSAFALWGLNWMHDDPPSDGGTEPGFADFLSSEFGYESSVERSDLYGKTLGIALYVTDPDPPLTYHANPEPTTFLVWGVLAMIGAGYCRRQR